MKVSITEFRDMVAEAVRRTLREAKKKDIPQRSEESIAAERDRKIRALPGYAHGKVLDMSKPLGKRNLAKRQGASNMGNWTSESALPDMKIDNDQWEAITKILAAQGMDRNTAIQTAAKILKTQRHASVDPAQHGLDDPSALGIEAKRIQVEAVRQLVRMIVDEEVRVRGR